MPTESTTAGSGINVIIPLGGLHSRFSNNGYLLPAPLVRIFGKEIILWTLTNIRLTHEDTLTIVYNPRFLDVNLLEGIVRKLHPRASFAYLDSASRGPIDTILTGLKSLSSEQKARPTICMDGDGYFSLDVTSLYRSLAKENVGGVISYKDLYPKPMYSYVKVEGPKKAVVEIREKEKISDWANTGTYCFPSGTLLQKYIEKVLATDTQKPRKYGLYTSSVISVMMEEKCPFRMIECNLSQFASLGSPELIKEFAKKQNKNITRQRFCFDLEGTLVTPPKIPGDYSTCEAIKQNVGFVRALSNMGHTIIIQSTIESTSGKKKKKMQNVFHEVLQMLEDLNIPHDDIHFGKPKADFYIDDEAIYSGHDLSKELGFYDLTDITFQRGEKKAQKDKEKEKEGDIKKSAKKVALAQHMKKFSVGDEDVYMNTHTGLPIFRVQKIDTFLLFDLDGTMMATDPVYVRVFDEILRPYGHKVDKKFFEHNIHGKVDEEIFLSLLPKALSQQERTKIMAEKDRLFRKIIFAPENKLLVPMPGLVKFLDWAESHGIRSACVTNCPRSTAEALLAALDLRRRMDFLIIGAECTRAKPFPDPYLTAMSRLGARPEDCIIFEDSRSGMRSAVASEARLCIGIRSSLNDHVLMQHGANATVGDFTEVTPELFNQLHSSNLSNDVEQRVITALKENGFPVKAISSARQLPYGNVAQCLRMTLVYTTESEEIPYPKVMILKMESEKKDQMVSALQLYEREWQFYQQVSREVTVRVPRVYATIVDDEQKKCIGVVMEDLEQIESVVKKETLTLDDAKNIATELARMHAQFWNRCPRGVKKANDPDLRKVADELKNRWSDFKTMWNNQLLEDDVSNGEIIMAHINWIQDQMSQPPFTLCHGSVEKTNIFFMKVLRETPALLDWQFTSAAKGVSDLALLVISSFPVEQQAAIEHQLIEVYHRALRMNGIFGYSLKDCWNDYKMSLMQTPFITAVWYGSLALSELVNPDYPTQITRAVFKAISRHKSVALLPEYFSMSLTQRCKKALRKQGYPVENVIVDAKKLKGGYICETLRLTIEYEQGINAASNPEKYPTNCVLKAEAPESSDHQTALNLHLYDREWHFYEVMNQMVPVRCPKYYASVEKNDGKGTMGILMENLMIPGAVLCPKLDYNGIQILVDNAAKLHAKFWNDEKLKQYGVHPLNGPWFQPSWEQKIKGHWPDFKRKWAAVLSGQSIAEGEMIVNNFRFIQNHLASPPFTFLHGDVKPANMFMLKGDIPAFIDWQYTKIGKGVCDIVFFLIEGYPEAQQRELEGKVRAYYHECLTKKYGIKNYTIKQCEKDWAIACMYFPIYVAMWFGTTPDEQLVDEMFPRRFVPRAFDAISRNKSVSYLPGAYARSMP